MDDLTRFCVRMLGDGPAARTAVQDARAGTDGSRSAMLRAAVAAVRQGSEPASEPAPNAPAAADPDDPDRPTDPDALPQTIARELAAATAGLPIAQREALALRELLGLGYPEIAEATGASTEAWRCCWRTRAWTCGPGCAGPVHRRVSATSASARCARSPCARTARRSPPPTTTG